MAIIDAVMEKWVVRAPEFEIPILCILMWNKSTDSVNLTFDNEKELVKFLDKIISSKDKLKKVV